MVKRNHSVMGKLPRIAAMVQVDPTADKPSNRGSERDKITSYSYAVDDLGISVREMMIRSSSSFGQDAASSPTTMRPIRKLCLARLLLHEGVRGLVPAAVQKLFMQSSWHLLLSISVLKSTS